MTAADKKMLRRVRHELQQDVRPALQRARMMGSYARSAQIQAAAKIVADRYLGLTRHVPTKVQPIAEVNKTGLFDAGAAETMSLDAPCAAVTVNDNNQTLAATLIQESHGDSH